MPDAREREVQLARVNIEGEGFADADELEGFLTTALMAASAEAYGEDGFRTIWLHYPRLVTGSVSTSFIDGVLYVQVPVGEGDWKLRVAEVLTAGMDSARTRASGEGRAIRWSLRSNDDVRPTPDERAAGRG